MRTTDIIQSLVQTTERLGDLVDVENVVLKDRQPHKLANNYDEKDRLVTVYEREMSELRANPTFLERSNTEEVGRLRAATRRFQEVLEEHRRLVQTAKSVTDRMIRTITEEIVRIMQIGLETDGPMGGGHSEEVFRSVLNDEYAKVISGRGGIGIADTVYLEILKIQEKGQQS